MSLKQATASTLKWNTIDRLGSQIVYAAVGLVLANKLDKMAFGLVATLMIFQSFASVFVDSGFGAALLRLKRAGQKDYSTVFWFNLGMSLLIYTGLWFAIGSISNFFNVGQDLVSYSRIMFLSFILNGLGIVQTNRLMKKMRVRQIAVSNIVGLSAGGLLGVGMALGGYGAWSLVWQTVAQSAIRSGWLWATSRWRPSPVFSSESFSKIWRVGLGVFSSSFLNTFFLNIYNFVIGGWYSVRTLGVYNQADKWSKMGCTSITQVLTSSFVPLLSKVQDKPDDFLRYVLKINRFTAFISFPFLLGLATVATPLFHFLFADKWDSSIVLFQILCVRGLPLVAISLSCNYLLALGYARSLVAIEVVKDAMLIAAIFATVWKGSLTLLVWGQLGASALTSVIVLFIVCRNTGFRLKTMLSGLFPFLPAALAACGSAWVAMKLAASSFALQPLIAGCAAGIGVYFLILILARVPEPMESLRALKGKIS